MRCWSSGAGRASRRSSRSTRASRPTTWPTTFRVGVEGKVPALVPLAGEMPPVDYPLPLDIPVTVDGELIGGSGTLRSSRPRSSSTTARSEPTRTPASSLSPARSTSPRAGPAGPRTSTRTTWASRSTASGSNSSTPRPRPRPPTSRAAPLPRPPGCSSSRRTAKPASCTSAATRRTTPRAAFTLPGAALTQLRCRRGPGVVRGRPRARRPGRERPIVGQVPPRAHGGEPGGGRDAAQVVRGAAAGWSCARPVGVCGETGSWS